MSKPNNPPPNAKRRQSIPVRKCVILSERCAYVTPQGRSKPHHDKASSCSSTDQGGVRDQPQDRQNARRGVLSADAQSNGGVGVELRFVREIVWPDGRREISGATPKALPAPDDASRARPINQACPSSDRSSCGPQ